MDDVKEEDGGVLLERLAHESAEYKRLWGIIDSLRTWVSCVTQELELTTNLQNQRLQHLEEKIVKQRRALHQLDECRAYERETERMLVDTLWEIRDSPTKALMLVRANDALVIYEDRKGPRPTEEDAEA